MGEVGFARSGRGLSLEINKTMRPIPYSAKALADARGSVKPDVNMSGLQARQGKQQNVQLAARATAEFLKSPNGPRIAVMEIQGWDTHFGQAWRSKAVRAIHQRIART